MPPRMFGSWTAPETLLGDREAELKEMKRLAENPEPESPDNGGTSHELPRERLRASFDPFQLTLALDGSPKAVAHRRWLWAAGELYDNSQNAFMTREELVTRHVETFLGIHKKFTEEGYRPEAEDILMMSNAARNQGAFGLHFGAFASTIASQGTPEQVMEWAPNAFMMKITGCLAQTELGHGSNVRGLQTVAEYDPATEEFVINTPTLKSIKWWPGGLGKQSNFTVVYANLITQGKEYGFHSFMMQLRDDQHRPMPGVEVGEVGPKMGDNGTETGYLRLTDVRIPRAWLLAKYQTVEPNGDYVKTKKTGDSKTQYTTMLSIRSGLVMSAGYRLAQAVTIAVRYSCVRRQGFMDTSSTSRNAPENQIIEYQMQQYRIFKQLALAYAMVWTGKLVSERFKKVMAALSGENPDTADLPEMHAISSGLKALCTFEGAEGMSECRRVLGGHGILLAGGVAEMAASYATYNTAEGDRIVLELQTARYLLRQLEAAREGQAVVGLCAYLTSCKDRAYDPTPELRTSASHESSFLDLNVLVKLMRGRALNAVVNAGDRLEQERARAGPGKPDAAWNACAVDLVAASRAHCYYLMLQTFSDVVNSDRFKDPAVKAIMTAVCRLFALQNVAEDLGAFELTHPQKAALRAAIRGLLPVIRNDAVALTDAFEFNDGILNSALGRHDGRVYESLYASAKASPLNRQDPFPAYDKFLKDHMDQDFIKEKMEQQRQGKALAPKL